MEKVTEIKLAIAGLIGVISACLGWFGWLVVIFVAAMIVDYITGSQVALKQSEWESKRARDGIWHKLGCIIAIAVAGGADFVIGALINNISAITLPFDYTVLICPLVLVWYIITEFGSIIENVGLLGAPLPGFLVKMIKALGEAVDSAGDMIDKE